MLAHEHEVYLDTERHYTIILYSRSKEAELVCLCGEYMQHAVPTCFSLSYLLSYQVRLEMATRYIVVCLVRTSLRQNKNTVLPTSY